MISTFLLPRVLFQLGRSFATYLLPDIHLSFDNVTKVTEIIECGREDQPDITLGMLESNGYTHNLLFA